MPTIFDLETISTSINEALRANREGNAARRQEALKNAFTLLQGAQTAAQTRETMQRTTQAAELFPSVKTTSEQGAIQAGQQTALGAIDVSAATRKEESDLAISKRIREWLAVGGSDPETEAALLLSLIHI